MRSFLHFHIGLRQILSHNSHTEQLNAANKCNDTYQGWPSTDRISKNKLSNNDKYAVYYTHLTLPTILLV